MVGYLRMFYGPGGRCKVSEALKVDVCESRQDIGEITAHGDSEPPATFDHRDDGGYSRPGLLAPDMDPVASAHRDSPDILPMSVMN